MHRITIEYGAPTDAEEFDRYYRDVHVPIAAQLPGLRRFTTSHPRGLGTASPHFVAELWFDDADALKTALKSPEMATTGADAQNFTVESMVMFSGEVTETPL